MSDEFEPGPPVPLRGPPSLPLPRPSTVNAPPTKRNTPGSLAKVSEEEVFEPWSLQGPSRGPPTAVSVRLALWAAYDSRRAQIRRLILRKARENPRQAAPVDTGPRGSWAHLCHDRPLPSRLQTAPSCGLVALRVAAEVRR